MSSPSPDHKTVVRQEFTQQAQAYAANARIKNPDRLAALVQAVRPQPGARVLDVATGPGYVAAAFAEAGCEVVGLDLTPAPLALAEQMRQERGRAAGEIEHYPRCLGTDRFLEAIGDGFSGESGSLRHRFRLPRELCSDQFSLTRVMLHLEVLLVRQQLSVTSG